MAVEAKKFEFPIAIIAGSADLIVIGQIEEVSDKSYTFKVVETLKGQTYHSISVNKFREWECDIRFDLPKKGQKLCLFLNREQTGWEIINGSNGELPIFNDSITLKKEAYDQNQREFKPYIVNLLDFKLGIKAFCECYRVVGRYGTTDKWHFNKIGDVAKIQMFQRLNSFSAWLNSQMLRYPFE